MSSSGAMGSLRTSFECISVAGQEQYATAVSSLRKLGLVPTNAYWEMGRRMLAWRRFQEGVVGREELLAEWETVLTGDGVVSARSDLDEVGDLKIHPLSPRIRKLTTRSRNFHGFGIPSRRDPYPDLEWIPATVVRESFCRDLEWGEARRHPGWLALTYGNAEFVDRYEKALFEVAKLQWQDLTDPPSGWMAIWPHRPPSGAFDGEGYVAVERPLQLGGVSGQTNTVSLHPGGTGSSFDSRAGSYALHGVPAEALEALPDRGVEGARG